MDFLSDVLTDRRRFCIFAVVNGFTWGYLTLVAGISLSDTRVARELDASIARRTKPLTCVSDNDTELTSLAILK